MTADVTDCALPGGASSGPEEMEAEEKKKMTHGVEVKQDKPAATRCHYSIRAEL